MSKKPIIVLAGPTSVGKSKIALYLARQLSADIISADSRQVYRGMNIGTAKPAMEDMKEIRHHMVDIVNPDERFSAGRYKDMVSSIISGMHEDGMMPLIVGGTGLYIKAVVYGLWEGPSADWELRRRLKEEELLHGDGYLYGRLSILDPDSARDIHPKDIAKIIRALEVFYKTGRPLAQFHRLNPFSGDMYEPVMVGLRRGREDLYRRIGQRVERMIEEGLIDEVRALLDKGYGEDLGAMKGLGYKQIVDYLEGRCTIDEAIGLIKRDTRRYAKRQFTWFNRDRSIRWIDIDEWEAESVTFEKTMELISGTVDTGYIKERSRS
ncbi:MAG TPA: tRNA (adenosine(37)-N6)-dimethylallyltransferase MiaA [Nitrospiria bacterium]|nr:tRNA (adenosine(37)-N6)-dimethylallyltransferase MiaA [Nitrospiria bacterium]